MNTKVILFDLDGTLLPLNQDVFMQEYFGGLAKKMAPYGYQPEKLIETIWLGTKAMVKNDGKKTNEEVFWDVFASVYGDEAKAHEKVFEEFYKTDFQKVKKSTSFNEKSQKTIEELNKLGFKMALATNPLFPRIATESRIKWAGVEKDYFKLITTYENSRHCKPNPEYYLDIAKFLNVHPQECLMVGNDVTEDMIAKEVGMKVFLITDCLINKEGKDISSYPQGNFDKLISYIKSLKRA